MVDTATRRLMCPTSRCCPWFARRRIPAVCVELLRGFARQNPLVRGSIIQSSAALVIGMADGRAQSIFKSCFQKCAAYVYIAHSYRKNNSGALCTGLVASLMLTSEPLRLCAGFLFRENRHGTRFLIESQPLLPILISKQGFTCVPGHPCHGVALLETIVVTNVVATVT